MKFYKHIILYHMWLFLLLLQRIPVSNGEPKAYNVRFKDTNDYLYFSGDRTTWIEAYLKCINTHGGRLLELESIEELNVVQHILIKVLNAGRVEYWVGAADVFTEGHWIWIYSGKEVDPRLWNHPKFPKASTSKNCGILCGLDGFKFEERKCSKFNYFICKHNGQKAVCKRRSSDSEYF